jgi:MFS family permease
VRRNDTRIPFMTGMKSFDWPGTFTILAATILLLVGLQLGGTSSYSSPSVICLLVFGSLSFLLFPFTQWWDEKRGGSPIMPLRIFRDISNLSALGVCACDALVFNSVAYFLPLYFQLVLSSSPSTSGVYMLAVAVPLAIVSFLGGWIINKTGRYLEVLQAGLALMTVGVGLFILFATTLNLGMIVGFLVIIGIGFGPNFSTPLIALQTRIREADIAVGTSAFGFVRMVSGAIGVVVGQVVFQLLMKPHYGAFRDVGLSVEFADMLAGGEAISQANKIALLSETQRGAVKGGLNEALRGTWIFFTVVSGLGLCVSFGIARKKLAGEGGGKEGTAHRGVDEEVGMRIVDI